MSDDTDTTRWSLPGQMDVPRDELKVQLEVYEETILLRGFENGGAWVRTVSADAVANAFTQHLGFSSGLLPKETLWWSQGETGQVVALWRPPKVWPVALQRESGEPFAFAGLWDGWRDPKGEVVRSCAIITTSANELLSPIHDRMPVILPRELEPLWLDHDIQDYAALAGILTPYITDEMEAYEVSSLVNSPANDGPEMVVPVGQVRPCDGPALRLPL